MLDARIAQAVVNSPAGTRLGYMAAVVVLAVFIASPVPFYATSSAKKIAMSIPNAQQMARISEMKKSESPLILHMTVASVV
jgi:hypothetical protein